MKFNAAAEDSAPHPHLANMKENLWLLSQKKMFSLSSLGYCKKHGGYLKRTHS